MLMRKFFVVLALATVGVAQAQIENDKNLFNHLSVGVGAGTTGISVDVSTVASPIIGLRAGVEFMPSFTIKSHVTAERPKEFDNVPTSLLESRYVNLPKNGARIETRGIPNLINGKLLCDIFTGRNSMFHFTVGAYVGPSTVATLKATDRTIAAVEQYNKDIKDGIINPEIKSDGTIKEVKVDLEGYHIASDGGRIKLDLRTWTVKPYLGIGVGRDIPRSRVSCKFDAGVMFWGSPKLYDYYADHEITKDEPGITNDFKDALSIINGVCVYPVLKFSVIGKIF